MFPHLPQALTPRLQTLLRAAAKPHRCVAASSTSAHVPDVRLLDRTSADRQLVVIDTHKMVAEFEAAGLTSTQSNAITTSLVNMASNLIEHQNRHLVTKPQHEITLQQMLNEMGGLRKDMVILERSEFSALKAENERLRMDMKMMQQAFNEQIDRVTNNMKLDLNLEKSRAREEYNKTGAEVIKLQNRIDTHVANLRTSFEQYRNDMFKYAAGTLMSCVGILLSFYRLYK